MCAKDMSRREVCYEAELSSPINEAFQVRARRYSVQRTWREERGSAALRRQYPCRDAPPLPRQCNTIGQHGTPRMSR